MIRIPLSAACGAALLIAGCRGTGPDCDLCTTSATVYGRVVDDAVRPVVGATVTVMAYRADCYGAPLPTFPVPAGPVVTDDSGEYATRLRSPSAPFDACLLVRVRPPSRTDVDAEGARVRFASDSPSESQARVRVDVTLPSVP